MGCACASWGASQCVAIASRGLSHGLNEVGDAPLGAELLVREVFLAHGSPQFTMLDIRPSLGCFLLAPAAVFVRWSEFEFGRDGPVHQSPSVSRSEPGSRRLSPRALGNGLGCLGVRWKLSPAKTFDDSYLTVYFVRIKKFGRQHPALRASSSSSLVSCAPTHSTAHMTMAACTSTARLTCLSISSTASHRARHRGATRGPAPRRFEGAHRASRFSSSSSSRLRAANDGDDDGYYESWAKYPDDQGSHPRSPSCSGRLGTANRTCGRPSPRGANPGQSC